MFVIFFNKRFINIVLLLIYNLPPHFEKKFQYPLYIERAGKKN